MTQINMDEVVRILHETHGWAPSAAYVEQTGGGVATIFAGAQRDDEENPEDKLWAAVAGPGSYGWGSTSYASTEDFWIGCDDHGETDAIDVKDFIEPDDVERQIAAIINAQAVKLDVGVPLTEVAVKAALRIDEAGDPVRLSLHTKACMANALICAVENIRDDPEESDLFYRKAIENNYPLEIADEYLGWRGRNNVICRCHVHEFV